MKTVLFLGAGFSRVFGQPVMRNFLDHMSRSTRVKEEDKRFMADLVLEARRANSFLESSPDNIEDILSFAVIGDRLGLFGNSGHPRARQVKNIMRQVYSTPVELTGDIVNYWNRYDSLRGVFGEDTSYWKDSVSIITTNYDINIESALHRLSVGVDYGSIKIRQNNSTDIQVVDSFGKWEGGVKIFKLHGSVNWFQGKDASDDQIIVESRIVSTVPHGHAIPYACQKDFTPPGSPLLIPPSFLKPDLISPLPTIWQEAASSLLSADKVVIIGYSFPQSDVEMKLFLAKSLAENPMLRQIVIVNPDAENIISRLKSPDSGYGSHFKEFLRAMPESWFGCRIKLDALDNAMVSLAKSSFKVPMQKP